MKRVLSIIFAIAATLVLFLAVLYNPVSSKVIVGETIANGRKIQQSFKNAVEFTDTFHQENDRLPSEAEFDNWANLQTKSNRSHSEMFLETNLDQIKSRLNNPKEPLLQDFGAPRDGSYIIGLWRGEWNEYYVSWKQETTVQLDPKAFYFFGNAMKDFFFLIFLFLIFAVTSIWLWLKSKKY